MKASMDKLFFLIHTYIKMYKAYPAGVFMKLIGLPAQMLMYIFLWIYIGRNNPLDINYMIMYYLITGLLGFAYSFHYISVDIERDIMEGGFANCLVRPYHYIIPLISKYIAWMCIYSIVYVPVLVLVYFMNGVGITRMLLFIVFCILGMFVEFMTWFFIGIFALYIERITGIIRIVIAIRSIISGALIPLSYMPEVIQKISDFAPFQYYMYVPVQVLIGNVSSEQIGFYLMMSICWIGILSVLSYMLWSIGMTRVQANIS